MSVRDWLRSPLSAANWAWRSLFGTRATLDQITNFMGGLGGYQGGQRNRLTGGWDDASLTENGIPAGQLGLLRARSWDLYRNNPHARKIVQTLETKVVGRGITPRSLATQADGSSHKEFRDRVRQLWSDIQDGIDVRGRPGYGGLDFVSLQRQVLRAVVLSGETLIRWRYLTPREQQARLLPTPLALQLIDAGRLVEESSLYPQSIDGDHLLFRGIELDRDGRRVAYHMRNAPLDGSLITLDDVVQVPADEVVHLYREEDIDQYRGVPWFAPLIMQMRQTADYQHNELKASALAACVSMWYRRASGSSAKLGLAGAGDDALTDASGNTITRLQPGMILNLGRDGEAGGFNPARPTTNVEAFIQHMLRSTSAAVPGLKSSTLTGDYRNSSFSSERSADNDAWPELVGVQDWMSYQFLQPLFDRLVEAAVLDGYFAGVLSTGEFLSRKANYLSAHWQGPLGLSITPKDDVAAAHARITSGLSSFQMECAKLNIDHDDVLRDNADTLSKARELGVPIETLYQAMGIEHSMALQSELDPSQDTSGSTHAQQTVAA